MRNSSSLDWLRFMHTPNDYRVSLFVKLDFANSVAFFKAFEKAINMYHTSLFFNCLTIPISGVKK